MKSIAGIRINLFETGVNCFMVDVELLRSSGNQGLFYLALLASLRENAFG
jgi:hypothetical protein